MWKLLLLSCISITIQTGGAQSATKSFICDNVFCIDHHLPSACPTKRNCTTQPYRKFLYPDKCNCCGDSFCIDYLKEGDPCVDVLTGLPEIDFCGPQLTCNPSTLKCEPITTGKNCMMERHRYDLRFKEGTVGTAQFKPNCDAVGDYTGRQCLPGSVCFCVNPDGERIFGVGLVTAPITCKCSRDIYNLQKRNSIKGLMPRCLPNGDYDELQCVGKDCWCMLQPNSKVIINEINKLSCFKKELHPMTPATYLRACEYAKSKIEIQHLLAQNESSLLLVPDYPRCDLDGYFSPVQSRKDKLICVDQNGDQLGDYEISKTSPRVNQVDCHCARVEKLMADNVNGKPVCCKHGNFRKWQCSGSLCYCVDRDGKQVVRTGAGPIEVHKEDLNQLRCYQDSNDDCVY